MMTISLWGEEFRTCNAAHHKGATGVVLALLSGSFFVIHLYQSSAINAMYNLLIFPHYFESYLLLLVSFCILLFTVWSPLNIYVDANVD